MGNSGVTDFQRISNEARERLVAELHQTVSTVTAAVDEAAARALEAAEDDARREVAAARIEYLAGGGLDSLRRLSGELVEGATRLELEITRLAEVATEAADALRARPPVDAGLDDDYDDDFFEFEADDYEQPEDTEEPGLGYTRFELPPILPSLAPDSPLDKLDAQRRAIAEAPTDFPPRRRRFDDASTRPVDVRLGVRVIVEQLRLAGATDSVIAAQLEEMGVDDPEAVLAQVGPAA